jgi:hypothetical protein
MSPNFALTLPVTAWNDPTVKKEKANGTYVKTKKEILCQTEKLTS